MLKPSIRITIALALILSVFPAASRALAQGRLYVPNQMSASVSVLDERGVTLETVDLSEHGFSSHAMPHQVATRSDGTAWFVTIVGDGYLAKFDANNRLVTKTPFEAPGMVVLDEARDRLYVSRALGMVNPPTRLGIFRASDLELLEEAEIFIKRPHALAVDTTSGRVFTGSLDGNQFAVYDPASGDAEIVNVDGPPRGFVGLAVSPSGDRLVATTQVTDQLLAFDVQDPSDIRHIASVRVAAQPYDIAYSPDGASVWFPNQRANSVTRVETTNWTISAVIEGAGFEEPHGVVVTDGGKTVYISSHGRVLDGKKASGGTSGPDMQSARANGTVSIIDATKLSVIHQVEVGKYAAAPGFSNSIRR